MTEKSSGNGESNCRIAQLSQEPVLFIYTNPPLIAGYVREGIPEAVFLVWGQGQRHVDGVYHPPQDNLTGVTGTLPCIQIV